jgi:hypothetical protein|tara:strand:- start:65 stop:328 length:264 start_codon:yes stop_codon:yes gene_type:complete
MKESGSSLLPRGVSDYLFFFSGGHCEYSLLYAPLLELGRQYVHFKSFIYCSRPILFGRDVLCFVHILIIEVTSLSVTVVLLVSEGSG